MPVNVTLTINWTAVILSQIQQVWENSGLLMISSYSWHLLFRAMLTSFRQLVRMEGGQVRCSTMLLMAPGSQQ